VRQKCCGLVVVDSYVGWQIFFFIVVKNVSLKFVYNANTQTLVFEINAASLRLLTLLFPFLTCSCSLSLSLSHKKWINSAQSLSAAKVWPR
jgi:ABC-type molybdate transport system permease subunit